MNTYTEAATTGGVAAPHRWRRVLPALVVGIVLAAGTLGAAAGTADATGKTYVVKAATQKMAGPHLTNYVQKGTYAKGKRLSLSCYTWGQLVYGWGGRSNLWYYTSDGVYVANVDIYTGTNNPVTRVCPKVSLAYFVADTRGKTWENIAGTYSGECVSLTSQYIWRVYGIKAAGTGWGNGIDYRYGRVTGNKLKSLGFKWSTNKSFKNGDILVWNNGQWGHVGIYYNGKVFDQNDSRHSPARTANYSGAPWANGYLGRWSK